MVALKLKPMRPKIRRRGQRLIETIGGARYVYLPHGPAWRLVEASRQNENYVITYSPSGRYALAKGSIRGKPIQRVIEGGFFGNQVALRQTEDDPWLFIERGTGAPLIAAADTGIRNAALIASALADCIDHELAQFLGVSRVVCRGADVDEILTNPRYRALRDFQFNFTSSGAGAGIADRRHAENVVRHQLTNYDEMLREAGRDVGGLLYPEQYERVRQGVDAIVASCLRKPVGEGA